METTYICPPPTTHKKSEENKDGPIHRIFMWLCLELPSMNWPILVNAACCLITGQELQNLLNCSAVSISAFHTVPYMSSDVNWMQLLITSGKSLIGTQSKTQLISLYCYGRTSDITVTSSMATVQEHPLVPSLINSYIWPHMSNYLALLYFQS